MSRPPKVDEIAVLDAATWRFWRFGYHNSSIDDLVRCTGTTRHFLYSAFGSKRGLFLRCLDRYREQVVDPAFGPVEKADATLVEIRAYFETQISRAAKSGLPGPGCLIANSMTETAPHDADVMAVVEAHNRRLASGFATALRNQSGGRLPASEIRALAEMLSSSAQGLWSWSRSVSQPAPLRRFIKTLVQLIEWRANA